MPNAERMLPRSRRLRSRRSTAPSRAHSKLGHYELYAAGTCRIASIGCSLSSTAFAHQFDHYRTTTGLTNPGDLTPAEYIPSISYVLSQHSVLTAAGADWYSLGSKILNTTNRGRST